MFALSRCHLGGCPDGGVISALLSECCIPRDPGQLSRLNRDRESQPRSRLPAGRCTRAPLECLSVSAWIRRFAVDISTRQLRLNLSPWDLFPNFRVNEPSIHCVMLTYQGIPSEGSERSPRYLRGISSSSAQPFLLLIP